MEVITKSDSFQSSDCDIETEKSSEIHLDDQILDIPDTPKLNRNVTSKKSVRRSDTLLFTGVSSELNQLISMKTKEFDAFEGWY